MEVWYGWRVGNKEREVWKARKHDDLVVWGAGRGICTVSSRMSRNGASEDFIELAQSSLSLCLNCGDLEFFVPSRWLGCLSLTLVHFSAVPTYTGSYGTGGSRTPQERAMTPRWPGNRLYLFPPSSEMSL